MVSANPSKTNNFRDLVPEELAWARGTMPTARCDLLECADFLKAVSDWQRPSCKLTAGLLAWTRLGMAKLNLLLADL